MQQRRLIGVIFVLSVFLFSPLVHCVEAISLEPVAVWDGSGQRGQKIFLSKTMQQWRPGYSVDVEQLLEGDFAHKFTQGNGTNLIAQGEEFWVRFIVDNQSHNHEFVLSLDGSQFTEAELIYDNNDGEGIQRALTGLNHGFESRLIDYHYVAFPLDIPVGQQQTIYLRLASPFQVYFSPVLMDSPGFMKDMSTNVSYGHLFVGLLIGTFIFLMILSFSTSLDKDVFYFGFFTLFAMLVILYINGFLMRYLPDNSKLVIMMWLWIHVGLQVSYLMVNKLYFHTKEKYPYIDIFLNINLALSGIVLVLPVFIPYAYAANAELWLVSELMFSLIVISLYIWFKERAAVSLFVIGNLGLLICSSLSTVPVFGIAWGDWIAKHGYEVGFCWQIIFFTWALSQKINLTREEENQLLISTQVAQAENKAKSDFIAKMSHEIRTPMNGVLGMAQLMRSTDINEEQKHYLNVIDSAGKVLLGVINDILDYSRLLAGKVELEKEVFNIQSLFAELNTLFGEQAHSKSLSFNTVVSSDMPLEFLGDGVRLRQILVNLLSNAFKFTEQGLVVLKASVLSTNDNVSMLQFTVSDSGIGIDSFDQKALFDDFTQSKISHARGYGGSGLGLSICKQFVEMMKGEISLSSSPGKGATFTFTVRLQNVVAAGNKKLAYEVETQSDSQIGKKKKNILVAEDNDINRDVVEGFLANMGYYQVDFAVNGQQALQCITEGERHYDLVLMDCEMPLLDGREVTRKVREWEQQHSVKHSVPIVALTAHASQKHLKLCLDSGMDDCLCKPIMFGAFSVTVNQYLNKLMKNSAADAEASKKNAELSAENIQ